MDSGLLTLYKENRITAETALELRDFTMGLLCGISSADLMPCAFKCVVTLKPQEHTGNFRHQLLFTKKDLKRLEQLNMLLVDNKEN